ncbi:RNA chaperone Hfq [Bacillus toyonensis]|uniref:RNA chaperone Hfq n=1 Tax=Bacillus toyonensis TaxID=155322 RepID=UPI002E1C1579|nr:RNA chaperone Hfq [Bacillus toyonensis]MED3088876.1 RNA chaperone Hfq [Bacillus toyonensis]
MLKFDAILQYLDYRKIACKFVLQNRKTLNGIIDGRDSYMIYVQTDDKSHCLFKGAIIDLIPAEKLDLKEVSRITSEWEKSKEVKKQQYV